MNTHIETVNTKKLFSSIYQYRIYSIISRTRL